MKPLPQTAHEIDAKAVIVVQDVPHQSRIAVRWPNRQKQVSSGIGRPRRVPAHLKQGTVDCRAGINPSAYVSSHLKQLASDHFGLSIFASRSTSSTARAISRESLIATGGCSSSPA